MRLLIFICSAAVSYLAWYLAAPLGFVWAFFISSAGALIGVYVGWKISRYLGI